ncbi:Neogenin [Armadillidium nasatum]|uniref:Cell adhesion molecule-related/down-regulated by oncogenes n=1 Tax=Armadillidium nasatum TaxID=96803 RepID=A0A5N5T5S9_9CRUS|nr:Neogenin [Armadillidium nasatum]
MLSSRWSGLKFVKEPSDVLVRRGSPTWLDCVVEGSPLPTITWRKDGSPLNLINDPNKRFLPNGTLFLRSVSNKRFGSSSDSGEYQCVADAPRVGKIVSSRAKLDVAGLPKFDEEPNDLTVYEGERARFPCAIQSRPPAKIIWHRNGHRLRLDSRMTLLPSGSLEIEKVTLQDRGEYYCHATNLDKTKVSHKATLTVKEALALREPSPPIFIALPSSVTKKVGQNLTLDCAANGYPEPTIVWLKDGATIDMQFLFLGPTRSLLITDLKEEDEGTFMCRAENRLDSRDAVASITVEDTPRFIEKPKNTLAYEKEDIELVCKVNGRPPPTVTWLKDGEFIKESEYFQFVGGTNLKILGLVPGDAGMYQCLASNGAGEIQASAQLIVLEAGLKPDQKQGSQDFPSFIDNSQDKSTSTSTLPKQKIPSSPRHLQPVVSSNRYVTLSWHEPELNNENIIGYSVFYRQEGSDRERVQNVSASSSLDDLDVYKTHVGNLNPNSTYLVRVVAHTSDHIVGESSPDVRFTTSPDLDLPDPPKNLRVTPLSPTAIRVEWIPPPPTKTPVSGYVMYYMEVGSAEEHELELFSTTHELIDLHEFTEYSVWLVAVNANGMGDPTHEVTARTFSALPSGQPQNVTVEPVSSRSLILRWEPPPPMDQNGIITGYKIRYKKRGSPGTTTKTTDGNRRLYVLTDLEKNTLYAIKLSAMTVNGSGPATNWIQAETFANDLDENSPPGQPANLRDPNANYVISVRAFNSKGSGQSIYEQVRTLSRKKEPQRSLSPPIGLNAEVLTPFTISLQWTDTTLNENQYIGDRGHYTVRYTTFASASSYSPKYKYKNVSDVTCLIDNLKPATMYEFSVKAVKGRRESDWSLVATKATSEARPSSPPRDVTVVTMTENPTIVVFNWQPPKQANGKITGYFIFYTTDPKSEWAMEEVHGDEMSCTLRHLTPATLYYYKMQARNSKGFGPFSAMSNFTTLSVASLSASSPPPSLNSSDSMVVIAIGGVIGLATLIGALIGLIIYCRRGRSRRQGSAGGTGTLNKNKVEVKPPDLWIHHDHLELKNLDKNDRSHSPTQTTVLSHAGPEFEPDDKNTTYTSTSTLDRRTPYQSTYLPVIGGSTSSSVYSDGTLGRPSYSLPQYPTSTSQGYTSPQENPYVANTSNSLGSSDGSNTLGKRPGNPLRSFSVPAPPQSAPTTPQPKHIVAVRPQGSTSPFKKALNIPPPAGLPNNIPLSARRVLPVSRVDSLPEHEELNEGLLHGYSTEELTQEMANLEGLMKDLSAITANQFNC